MFEYYLYIIIFTFLIRIILIYTSHKITLKNYCDLKLKNF